MNTLRSLLTAPILAVLVFGSVAATADTLLVDRVKRESAMDKPGRGATMDTVLAHFGEPASRSAPVGGDKPQHPPITRWTYADFSVYFEHDKVIDTVVNRSTAFEQGVRPVQ